MAKPKKRDMLRFNLEKFDPACEKLVSEIRAGNSCSVFGAQNSMRAAISASLGKKILYLTAGDVFSENAVSSFEIMGLNVVKFPAIQDEFLYKKAQSSELYIERLKALASILTGDFDVLVSEVSALYSFLPLPNEFFGHITTLKAGQDVDIAKLEQKLIEAGYKKDEMLSQEGEFSKRGEVLDIFPLGAKYPFRIDFFDTQIETIKIFDIVSQKATKDVNSVTIYPVCNVFLSDDETRNLVENLLKLKTKTNNTDADVNDIFNAQIDDLIFMRGISGLTKVIARNKGGNLEVYYERFQTSN